MQQIKPTENFDVAFMESGSADVSSAKLLKELDSLVSDFKGPVI